MTFEDIILINKYGQQLTGNNELLSRFSFHSLIDKREYLKKLCGLIVQSKAKDEDIELAIKESGLKPTFTPCILLRKGVASHHLKKLIDLPETELSKSFILLLCLFKIAYQRRFNIERNDPNKWWYWDLSDENRVNEIRLRIKP